MQRETGYYWVNFHGKWKSLEYVGNGWVLDNRVVLDSSFESINETRILNPDEQPIAMKGDGDIPMDYERALKEIRDITKIPSEMFAPEQSGKDTPSGYIKTGHTDKPLREVPISDATKAVLQLEVGLKTAADFLRSGEPSEPRTGICLTCGSVVKEGDKPFMNEAEAWGEMCDHARAYEEEWNETFIRDGKLNYDLFLRKKSDAKQD